MEEIKTLDERVYELHGSVSSLDTSVKDLGQSLKDHIRWAEGLVTQAKNDEKMILDKFAIFERRIDKIEIKVAIGVAIFMFALNHIGWLYDHLQTAAVAMTSIAMAMTNN